MRLVMIRHGKTKGNLEKRYVGSTDEGLLEEAKQQLKNKEMPPVDVLYVSPMKRCRQTANILYKGQKALVVSDFRECDFGQFEYKNYEELNGNPDYQKFLDTMGMCGFPGGETRTQFQERCCMALKEILDTKEIESAALVVHGGTIMALLSAFSNPHRDYYDWQIGNGEGFEMEVYIKEGKIKMSNIQKI